MKIMQRYYGALKMTDIEHLKSLISIHDIAVRYNADPQREDSNGAVKCKSNPLRDEKTSSLFIYPSTQSYFDFGSNEGGDIIDFVMLADGVNPSDAINTLKYMAGIDLNKEYPEPKPIEKKNQSYLHNHESISNIWNRLVKLTKTHQEELLAIAPEYLFKEAKKEDLADFHKVAKYDDFQKTIAVLVTDNNKNCSIRFRRQSVGGEIKKWVALKDAKASVPFVRDNKDSLIIVVEGTHDYLSAILCGFSVIGLPQTGFKLDASFITGRKVLFIADDDRAGVEGMQKTITFSGGAGLLFNHEKFRKDNNISGCKDFSDYITKFTSLHDFQKAIAIHIETIDEIKDDISSVLRARGGYVTEELLNSMKEIDVMIDGVLPRGQITTIVGKPNVGKSALTLSIINKLLKEDKLDNMIYFDPDNPLIYSAQRVKTLTNTHNEKNIFYYSGSSSSKVDMHGILDTLSAKRGGGERTVIVIDSLKNFINGSINDDKVINPLFDKLQAIRDNFKATIIVLHHTKKGKDEEGKLSYVGSQVIEASTDNMFLVNRVDDTVMLDPHKMRALLERRAYKIAFNEMEIVESEYIEEKNNDEDDTSKDDIIADAFNEYLIKNGAMKQVDLSKVIPDLCGQNKAQKILWDDRYRGKLWRVEKLSPKGYLFTAIQKSAGGYNVVETTYNADDMELF